MGTGAALSLAAAAPLPEEPDPRRFRRVRAAAQAQAVTMPKHPLPWQNDFYNETLNPAITEGLALETRTGNAASVTKPGLPGTGTRRSDAQIGRASCRERVSSPV